MANSAKKTIEVFFLRTDFPEIATWGDVIETRGAVFKFTPKERGDFFLEIFGNKPASSAPRKAEGNGASVIFAGAGAASATDSTRVINSTIVIMGDDSLVTYMDECGRREESAAGMSIIYAPKCDPVSDYFFDKKNNFCLKNGVCMCSSRINSTDFMNSFLAFIFAYSTLLSKSPLDDNSIKLLLGFCDDGTKVTFKELMLRLKRLLLRGFAGVHFESIAKFFESHLDKYVELSSASCDAFSSFKEFASNLSTFAYLFYPGIHPEPEERKVFFNGARHLLCSLLVSFLDATVDESFVKSVQVWHQDLDRRSNNMDVQSSVRIFCIPDQWSRYKRRAKPTTRSDYLLGEAIYRAVHRLQLIDLTCFYMNPVEVDPQITPASVVRGVLTSMAAKAEAVGPKPA